MSPRLSEDCLREKEFLDNEFLEIELRMERLRLRLDFVGIDGTGKG